MNIAVAQHKGDFVHFDRNASAGALTVAYNG